MLWIWGRVLYKGLRLIKSYYAGVSLTGVSDPPSELEATPTTEENTAIDTYYDSLIDSAFTGGRKNNKHHLKHKKQHY